LAPTVRDTSVRDWVSHDATPRGLSPPVLWYLGLNESQAGRLVAETPIVVPPRFVLSPRLWQTDQAARETYRALLPEFALLAQRAWLAFALVTALALATFLWTNRRLPDRSAPAATPSRIRASVRRLMERQTEKDPRAQAGFFFALQTLARSAPHRTIIAISASVGLTHALIVLAQRGWHSFAVQSTPLGVLAISPLLLMSLVIGVSYAVTVPAEPAASWTIRMTWLGDECSYLAGVKCAAMLLATLLLVLLLPLHMVLLGIVNAFAHLVFSLLFASVALDALFLTYWKVPFACSYVPIQNPKIVWPAGVASVMLVTYGFAAAERWASHAGASTVMFGVLLGAIALFVRGVDRARRREQRPFSFDDRPAPPTQRLGLFEHVTVQD